MKGANRILLAAGFLVLLCVSWIIVLNAKSASEKQSELIKQANDYIIDEIYILAVPLLEEASGYKAAYTLEAEETLKTVYKKLIGQRGYRRKYADLLEKQMKAKETSPAIFLEAAEFYLAESKLGEALAVLADGIQKTKDRNLSALYEDNRYKYSMGYNTYEDLTEIFEGTIGVKNDGFWGLADFDGSLRIPCEYEKISTYSSGRLITSKNGEIFAVDIDNNRLALLKEKVFDFGNYAEGRISFLTEEGWRRASGDFEMGIAVFEQIGTYSGGYAAALQNGKWGVVDLASKWLISAEYDGVITDGLGRCFFQGAVFVKKNGAVYLFSGGKQTSEDFYEDACPFGSSGYAAVKKNGLWGFIDNSGELKIGYKFEEALSFGQHLAAVKQGELWGYINLYGDIVIEPLFKKAKSFSEGSAPVLTENGWRFISLFEYKKTGGLFK
ncbi:MAG: WG repeat-containing protein [Oscillospiraceae bacterium]|nr:WG repeat-containing protein [Oscillospiraceae bacterium]